MTTITQRNWKDRGIEKPERFMHMFAFPRLVGSMPIYFDYESREFWAESKCNGLSTWHSYVLPKTISAVSLSQSQVDQATQLLVQWTSSIGGDACWYYPDIFNSLCTVFGVKPQEHGLPTIGRFKEGCARYQTELYGRSLDEQIANVPEPLRTYLNEMIVFADPLGVVRKNVFAQHARSEGLIIEQLRDALRPFAAMSRSNTRADEIVWEVTRDNGRAVSIARKDFDHAKLVLDEDGL